jgi:hypothetical protein
MFYQPHEEYSMRKSPLAGWAGSSSPKQYTAEEGQSAVATSTVNLYDWELQVFQPKLV